MKYGIWFVRLLFAAWMIPAGLNHFIPIFPQPMGSQPLSQELIVALIDTNLFDLVKAVELLAGVGALFGLYTPLVLLMCLPVSFCVFYWDAPLEGWGSGAARFGYSVLLSNVLLCQAYCKSYLPMFSLRTEVNRKQLVLVGRLCFGAWMLLNGANYLFFSFWPAPTGQEPLAIQLMTSLVNSRLLDVAMVIQLLAGALLITGTFVPVALYALMPISCCALYWSVVLNHQPLHAVLSFAAFSINGLLMLGCLPYFHDMLERRVLAFGEKSEDNMNFDTLFTNPKGCTARAPFVPALITVLAVIAFLTFIVTGRTSQFCVLVLLYPAFVLLAQRLQDMGVSLWLLMVPLLLMLTNMAILLSYISLGGLLDATLLWLAPAAFAVFALWGCVSHGKMGAGIQTSHQS